MPAVFVNMLTVLCGSLIGIFFKSKLNKKYLDTIFVSLALVTLVIGISSAIVTSDFICMIICTVLGTALGCLLKLEDGINGVGDAIKQKLFGGKELGRFTEGFVSACILFCIGSMTIVGSFEAGIDRNYSTIFAKSALDFVSSMMFGAAMGIGVTFSVFFILVFQGGLTLLAGVIAPYVSAALMNEMSAVGGVILIGMAINMLELSDKKISVANMLPAVFLPAGYMYISDIIAKII